MNELTLSCVKSYYQDMNIFNSQKRMCNTNQECYKKFMSSIKKPESMNMLNQLLILADDQIKTFSRLHEIKWKILLFEEGEFKFPHTHGDTIFIPYNWFDKKTNVEDKVNTLIHEKIHIFQRLYSLETNYLLIHIWKYEIFNLSKKENVRHNPDINKINYLDQQGSTFDNVYLNNKQGCSQLKNKRDHPYEQMAYWLVNVLRGKTNPNKQEKLWIQNFL